MAEEHLAALKQARENFVRKRRAMAEQMIPAGRQRRISPCVSDVQVAIEALDRAIKDEESLPEDYALEVPEEPPEQQTSALPPDGSNVIRSQRMDNIRLSGNIAFLNLCA